MVDGPDFLQNYERWKVEGEGWKVEEEYNLMNLD